MGNSVALDSFIGIHFQLCGKDDIVEMRLQLLVAIVYAQLFEAVLLKDFKSEHIQ